MSEQYVVEFSSRPHFWGVLSSPTAFLFLIFLSTESSSSRVNGPSLMSDYLFLVIGSWVTSGGFPSKFSKCCFHRCIWSCSLVAFSLALAVLFLLLTSFIVCHAILDRLSLIESLILSIWFCMYSVCSFRFLLANSFCAFLSFRELVLVVQIVYLNLLRTLKLCTKIITTLSTYFWLNWRPRFMSLKIPSTWIF